MNLKYRFVTREWMEEVKESIHRTRWNMEMLRKNKRYLFVLRIAIMAVLITIFTSIGFLESRTAKANLQVGIANKIIRFHVIANSDSIEDQAVKLKVKDAIVTALRPKMSEKTLSIDEARERVTENMEFIREIAIDTLQKNGFSYDVHVSLQKEEFPIKVYGDIALPAGEYEALCVRIGAASGHNWWCIVFPSLCYVDETYSFVPDESKEQLQHVLTDEEYDAITQEDKTAKSSPNDRGDGLKVKPKFKLWEYLKKYFS